MRSRLLICAFLALIPALALADRFEDDGALLFDGKNLDGWTRQGGKHAYAAVDGAVVGTSVQGEPNGFLCTDRVFTNFILTLEFFPDPKLNSGVQIRSNALDTEQTVEWTTASGEKKSKKIPAGRVHGYQVEIDPTPRAFSAGVYDEGRRGWLNDLKDNEPARKAFKPNAWNKLRIEANGPSIRTWLNGVPAADLTDDLTPAGFIGLQVHSAKEPGGQVKWRNIRLEELP